MNDDSKHGFPRGHWLLGFRLIISIISTFICELPKTVPTLQEVCAMNIFTLIKYNRQLTVDASKYTGQDYLWIQNSKEELKMGYKYSHDTT